MSSDRSYQLTPLFWTGASASTDPSSTDPYRVWVDGGICCLVKQDWGISLGDLNSVVAVAFSSSSYQTPKRVVVWSVCRLQWVYYLAFPSPQILFFELQCIQEVSADLRHLLLGCSVNDTNVVNNAH